MTLGSIRPQMSITLAIRQLRPLDYLHAVLIVVTLITPLWLWIAGLVVGAVLIYQFGL